MIFFRTIYRTVRTNPVFERWPTTKEFSKFIIVGASNTIVDFGVYLALTRFVAFFAAHLLISNGIAFVFGATNSFFLNKFWTFRGNSGSYHIQYAKFFVVTAGGFFLTQGIFWVGVQYIDVFDIFVKAFAVVIVVFWNFFMNKFWTFR